MLKGGGFFFLIARESNQEIGQSSFFVLRGLEKEEHTEEHHQGYQHGRKIQSHSKCTRLVLTHTSYMKHVVPKDMDLSRTLRRGYHYVACSQPLLAKVTLFFFGCFFFFFFFYLFNVLGQLYIPWSRTFSLLFLSPLQSAHLYLLTDPNSLIASNKLSLPFSLVA